MSHYAEHMASILGWTFGGHEWIVILVVALIIFGRRLPEVARNMGKSMTEFKKGLREAQDAQNEIVDGANEIKNDAVQEVKKASGIDEVDNV